MITNTEYKKVRLWYYHLQKRRISLHLKWVDKYIYTG